MLYEEKYTQGLTRIVEGFELPVRIPDEPPIETFQNYGLPIEQQVFRRVNLPREVYTSAYKELDKRYLDELAEEMWHKRTHGEWWLIKGKKTYINGWYWFHLNSWYGEFGGYCKFRREALDLFDVWNMAFHDPGCFGLNIVKARRIGDTEKILCILYDLVTRYKNSKLGSQNTKDDDAEKNYIRIVEANKRMPCFFAPVYQGNDDAKDGLVFKYKGLTSAQKAEGKGDVAVDELGSDITYAPCKFKEYDGQRLRGYLFDEYIKVAPKVLNVYDQWDVIKFTLTRSGYSQIVGKAFFCSTSEKIKGDKAITGDSIDIAEKMWEDSNPNERDEGGLTTSGLWRYFRGYKNLAPVDEYGDPDVELITKERNSEIAKNMKKKAYDKVEKYRRKMPETILDSLQTSGEDCPLHPELLELQNLAIKDGTAGMPAVRGNLVWKTVKFGDVVFVPGEDGNFWFSGFPEQANNKKFRGGRVVPGNIGWGCIGVDGFDHVRGVSDGAIAGFRNYNPLVDSGLEFSVDDQGAVSIDNKAQMKTNRFFVSYKKRPPHPDVFYEEVAKLAIFTGIMVFAERDKPGVLHYMERNGIGGYLLFRPTIYKYGEKPKDPGEKATVSSINTWMGQIDDHLYQYYETYTHQNIVDDFRQFNGANRTKCDLLVACGHAKMGAQMYDVLREMEERKKQRQADSGRQLLKTYD